mmetsp:Transcript_6133/g.17117  ORF Transcript_6133/g.17117 Transcript_6133/m.17117 type:complete len:259 (+) Transcript_6133:808-1584(+)
MARHIILTARSVCSGAGTAPHRRSSWATTVWPARQQGGEGEGEGGEGAGAEEGRELSGKGRGKRVGWHEVRLPWQLPGRAQPSGKRGKPAEDGAISLGRDFLPSFTPVGVAHGVKQRRGADFVDSVWVGTTAEQCPHGLTVAKAAGHHEGSAAVAVCCVDSIPPLALALLQQLCNLVDVVAGRRVKQQCGKVVDELVVEVAPLHPQLAQRLLHLVDEGHRVLLPGVGVEVCVQAPEGLCHAWVLLKRVQFLWQRGCLG